MHFPKSVRKDRQITCHNGLVSNSKSVFKSIPTRKIYNSFTFCFCACKHEIPHLPDLYRFTIFCIPTRSDSLRTYTNSIRIEFFQLLRTSQLNSLGSIQTIIKADSTMRIQLTPVFNQTDSTQFTAASTELNSLFTWYKILNLILGQNNVFIKD